MAGINHHDNIPLAIRVLGDGWLRGLSGLQATFIDQVYDQPVTILLIRFELEAARLDVTLQIEHHPKVITIARGASNTLHGTAGEIEFVKIGLERRILKVNYQTRRPGQGKHFVINLVSNIQHQPGMVRRRPDPHAFHVDVCHGCHRRQQRQHYTTGQAPSEEHSCHHFPAHLH